MEPSQWDTLRLASPHPTGDLLEDYALGRLAEPESARVETHLFICHACQDALLETDKYVAAMKAALVEPALQPEPSRWAALVARVVDSLRMPSHVPAFSVALAALTLVAILSQTYSPGARAREVEVTLRSVRGGLESLEARGPANAARMGLRLQSPHLEASQDFQARIVDAAGKPVWSGTPQFAAETGYVLHVDRQLQAGNYWVRLFDSRGTLLQEYGLRLE